MFIRRATSSETVAEGEFVCSYVHAAMTEKKEDGFATLGAVYLALKRYRADNAHITHTALKTDGAGAYSGVVFAVGLSLMAELTHISVDSHFTGESGKGKTQLNGAFGMKGSQVVSTRERAHEPTAPLSHTSRARQCSHLASRARLAAWQVIGISAAQPLLSPRTLTRALSHCALRVCFVTPQVIGSAAQPVLMLSALPSAL